MIILFGSRFGLNQEIKGYIGKGVRYDTLSKRSKIRT